MYPSSSAAARIAATANQIAEADQPAWTAGFDAAYTAARLAAEAELDWAWAALRDEATRADEITADQNAERAALKLTEARLQERRHDAAMDLDQRNAQLLDRARSVIAREAALAAKRPCQRAGCTGRVQSSRPDARWCSPSCRTQACSARRAG